MKRFTWKFLPLIFTPQLFVVPFLTSCNPEYVLPENALPFSVYSHNGMLLTGFKDDVDWEKFSDPKYDTMILPQFLDGTKLFSVTQNAFFNPDSSLTTIPSNIKYLKFQYQWNYTYFGECCFKDAPFLSLNLPNLCTRYMTECFSSMKNLTDVYCDLRYKYIKGIDKKDQGTNIFSNLSNNGIIHYHKDGEYVDPDPNVDPEEILNNFIYVVLDFPQTESINWIIEFEE